MDFSRYKSFCWMQGCEFGVTGPGIMVINIVDAQMGRMIWRSQAVRCIDIHPEISEKNIGKGISIALKDLPLICNLGNL